MTIFDDIVNVGLVCPISTMDVASCGGGECGLPIPTPPDDDPPDDPPAPVYSYIFELYQSYSPKNLPLNVPYETSAYFMEGAPGDTQDDCDAVFPNYNIDFSNKGTVGNPNPTPNFTMTVLAISGKLSCVDITDDSGRRQEHIEGSSLSYINSLLVNVRYLWFISSSLFSMTVQVVDTA